MADELPLREAVEAFLLRTKMSATMLGHHALSDRHFVKQIRAGRRCWPETEAKVRKFMAEHEAAQQRAPDARSAA